MKSFAVRAGLVALFVGFMAFNTTAVAQQGLTFTIFVTTSFGTQFQDCMRFDPVSPGILVVDGLADPLVYAKDDLNFSISGWQSTSFAGTSFGISFNGTYQDPFIISNGVSEEGSTFVVSGFVDGGCIASASSTESGANPYSAPE
ncbi:MAG: hypothetical protein ETSY1_12455 [Candidatus Entotheonella factor]|uniref:Uncharacterized protein n=1 Tax=Entotheonella factor TaxID=1429438 RepID=W4LPU3_ENTF1|nr:MAG: hypothetical protein ETSY1_12455 [Candidatus Entotheonella factor]